VLETELTTLVVQCGAAGLIGWMWLSERRAAAERERQLTDAHERIVHERTALDVVLRSVEGSTRALTAIEVGQRQLLELLTRAYGLGPPPAAPKGTPAGAPRARGHRRGRRPRSGAG
jgi:hypothetical protein